MTNNIANKISDYKINKGEMAWVIDLNTTNSLYLNVADLFFRIDYFKSLANIRNKLRKDKKKYDIICVSDSETEEKNAGKNKLLSKYSCLGKNANLVVILNGYKEQKDIKDNLIGFPRLDLNKFIELLLTYTNKNINKFENKQIC